MTMTLSSKVCCPSVTSLEFRIYPYAAFDPKVPSLPASRMNNRQRGAETPSHGTGLSEAGKARLQEYRANRERQKGAHIASLSSHSIFSSSALCADGIIAKQEQRQDGPRGLGDFQRRSNKDRDGRNNNRNNRDDNRNRESRSWDANATPRSERGGREDGPSMRVPDVGWDSTPRNQRGSDGGWGGAKSRAWDAPTPRTVRGGSPDDDRETVMDAREWEEEQIRLDRDWYSGAEEGGLMGDEEHNPLAQYEDLAAIKQAEIAKKQVVRIHSLFTTS